MTPAVEAFRVALSKAHGGGNPYHDPDDGRFTTGSGGGSGSGIGASELRYPHGPSNNEKTAMHELHLAEGSLNTLRHSGANFDDPNVKSAVEEVRAAQAQVNRLRALRTAELQRVMRDKERAQYSGTNPNAQAQRRAEADRLVQQGQQTRRDFASRVDAATNSGRINTNPVHETPEAGTLRSAIYTSASRLARVASHISSVLTHTQGIAATSDYATIGGHLSVLQSHIGSLKTELAAVPKDTKILGREVSAAATRLSAQIARFKSALDKKSKKKK